MGGSSMNGMVLMEFCGRRFMGFDTEELKRSFYRLILKNPLSYTQISEYLVEFSNRGYHGVVIDYLIEYPLNLERKSARLVMEVLKDMPNRLLNEYGHFAHTIYDLYHKGRLDDKELSFENYLFKHPELASYSLENLALLKKTANS